MVNDPNDDDQQPAQEQPAAIPDGLCGVSMMTGAWAAVEDDDPNDDDQQPATEEEK